MSKISSINTDYTVVNLAVAESIIKLNLLAGAVPFLHGSPGIGKSAVVANIAKEHNLLLIDVRLSDREPTDLAGIPSYNADRSRATYVPFDEFPLENDPLPINPATKQEYKGWLILLDEFSNALPAVQSAAYKFVLDRKVGLHNLHEKAFIVAAGNMESDGALAQPMSTALISRFAHVYTRADLQTWVDAVDAQLDDSDILAYLHFRPDMFYTFDPDLTTPYACPRTWFKAAMVRKQTAGIGQLAVDVTLEGLIGKGTYHDFKTFLKLKDKVPRIEDILKDPKTAPLPKNTPEELGVMWATAYMLADHANEQNCLVIAEYLLRFPAEFIAAGARAIMNKYGPYRNTPNGIKFSQIIGRTLNKMMTAK